MATTPDYSVFDSEIGLNSWLQLDSALGSAPAFPDTGVLPNPANSPVNLNYALSGSEVGAIQAFGKLNFADTTEGWIQGMDTDGIYKWLIGGADSSIDWAVTTASTLTIVGAITATTGAIGGWTITSDTLYSLASGTPSASPADGIVLDSSDPRIIVYEDAAKRIEFGYLSAGVFGLKGYATDGTTVMFELSDTQQVIAGWNFDETYFWGLVSGTPTSAPSDGIVLASGSTGGLVVYEDTAKRVEVGYLSSGVYGLRAYAGDGTTVIFEASDTRQFLAGLDFTDVHAYKLASGTPTATPSDGLVIGSSTTPGITIYEDTAKRIELGYLSAGVFGLKGYATDGTTVTFELSDTQQFVGGWDFDNEKLSAGSVSIDGANEVMLFGAATDPTTGVGIFLGKDGADYEFRAGDPADEHIHWDGSGLDISGKFSTKISLTAGEDLAEHDAIIINSSGQAVRPSVVSRAFLTQQTVAGNGITDVVDGANIYGFKTSADPYVLAFVYTNVGGAATRVRVAQTTLDSSNNQVSSILLTSLNVSAGITSVSTFDCKELATDKVIVVQADTNSSEALIVDDMNTTLTQGTIVALTGAAGKSLVAVESATIGFFLYEDDATTGILFEPFTVSGTTITPGTPGTLLADATNVAQLMAVGKFGTTNNYLVVWQNATIGKLECIVATYNSGTATFSAVGTRTDFDTGVNDDEGAFILPLDDTHVLVVYSEGTNNIKARTVTRSGTTPTVNAAIELSVDTVAATGISVAPLIDSNNHFAVGGRASTSVAEFGIIRLDRDYEVVTEIGTATTVSSAAGGPLGVIAARRDGVCTLYETVSDGQLGSNMVDLTMDTGPVFGVTTAAIETSASGSVIALGHESGFSGLTVGYASAGPGGSVVAPDADAKDTANNLVFGSVISTTEIVIK